MLNEPILLQRLLGKLDIIYNILLHHGAAGIIRGNAEYAHQIIVLRRINEEHVHRLIIGQFIPQLVAQLDLLERIAVGILLTRLLQHKQACLHRRNIKQIFLHILQIAVNLAHIEADQIFIGLGYLVAYDINRIQIVVNHEGNNRNDEQQKAK